MVSGESGVEFAEWLRERLRARQMLAADLARSMGVRNGTVSRWLKGQRPEFDYCERIADGLRLSTEDVLIAARYLPSEPQTRDLDAPAEQIIATLRKVEITPRRFTTLSSILDDWRETDRERAER